ncbi:ubiquitin carboxyl-terminal hydrolase-domain-containing protein [Coniochaeta sp. 2T2.1]|nr:ubiquitin carboxyl-terminal hydrolase-domain-containing protein [Coniochaeta sp. 2T2.1]
MDADWDEVGRVPFPPPAPNESRFPRPPTIIAFDTCQELLWTGNEYGRVLSLYGTELQRYTSFRIHRPEDGPVRQLLFHDKGVIALGPRTVHMAMRRGAPIWNIRHDDMKDLHCMSFTSKGASEILVAGSHNTMFVIDINRGEIVKQVPTEHHYIIMKKSRYICAATKTGNVDMLDPISFKIVKTWNAHVSYINDMDAQNDFIVTCGGSQKQHAAQTYMLDPYVNVFDLKNMTSMSPIPFPSLAAYVRMHPRMLTTSIVVSQQGQMHVVDIMNPNTGGNAVRYANVLSYLNMVEIAPSGEALAMADSESNIHLWGSPSKIHFAEYAQPIEFAEPEEAAPTIDWAGDTPLNTIGMPYYRDMLASAWPPNLVSEVGAPPVRYDPTFIAGMKRTEWGLYGDNPRRTRRNQAENTRSSGLSANALQPPKFLSEKAREMAKSSGLTAPAEIAQTVEQLASNKQLESLKPDAPPMYKNVEIKYSKFGVDDFDFGYYNKTRYAGLENHISNSYANSLLQVMNYTPLLRNLALQHAATACLSDPCLLCELGYVFDMLQKAEGSTCQASNMLKALGNHPQAAPLGLLEEEPHSSTPAVMIQGLTRFLLDRISSDYRSIAPASTSLERTLFSLPPPPNPIDQEDLLSRLLATSAVSSIRCNNCRNESTRPGSTYVNDLLYPPPPKSSSSSSSVLLRGGQGQTQNHQRPVKTTFSQVLKASIERETTSKGWCSRCQRYQTLQTRKTIRDIPAVLALNAAVQTAEHRRLWATPGWLPEEIGVIVDPGTGQFFCYEGEDLKLHLQRGMHNVRVYSLVGVVVNVEGETGMRGHLVGMVNVSHSEPTPPAESRWHLFNDFSVRPVSAAEALTFNASWKIPSVLVFQLKTANNRHSTEWIDKLDTSILFTDIQPSNSEKTYEVLTPDERPGPHTIIALDTEFVSLKQPEIQMNSDGQRETIRPMSHALARVSVVRGQGEQEGLPFIDDYIAIKEPVVDYLTLYSGITAGDLDPRTTKHNLVSLKVAYKKLWVLLNLGCQFLGHGLRQDFRVINIQVPRSQIIDTIELFYLKSRLRKLSLAFLAWFLLKEDIQMETHDSIEDARTALKLYRRYLEFEDAGVFEQILSEIYRVGRDLNFKAPRKDDQVVQRTDTPPISVEGAPGPTTPRRPGASGQVPGSSLGVVPGWTPGKDSPFRR